MEEEKYITKEEFFELSSAISLLNLEFSFQLLLISSSLKRKNVFEDEKLSILWELAQSISTFLLTIGREEEYEEEAESIIDGIVEMRYQKAIDNLDEYGDLPEEEE